jgi:hypothetical protein
MDSLELMKKRLTELGKEREEQEQELDRYNQLLAMPFHLRIQEPELREQMQGFEERQKETFLNHSVKKWSIPKEQGLELFQEFFTEFLKGEVKSIYDFLLKRGYKNEKEVQND